MMRMFLGVLAVGWSVFPVLGEEHRIVGGYDAEEAEFPYQVSLRKGNSHFCGGSLLNEQWILTAAHCVQGQRSENVSAVVGTNLLSKGGERYEVEELIPHPLYSPLTVTNDIALIKLKTKATYSTAVKMIVLPEENVKDDEELTLSGWGTTTYPGKVPEKLQTIKLKSISLMECIKEHPTGGILPSNLCTFTQEGQGACHGDSGGPLALNGQQVGVVSWGIPCAKGKPDVFTRVYSYLDWIKSYIN